jgi:hypothetical protein
MMRRFVVVLAVFVAVGCGAKKEQEKAAVQEPEKVVQEAFVPAWVPNEQLEAELAAKSAIRGIFLTSIGPESFVVDRYAEKREDSLPPFFKRDVFEEDVKAFRKMLEEKRYNCQVIHGRQPPMKVSELSDVNAFMVSGVQKKGESDTPSRARFIFVVAPLSDPTSHFTVTVAGEPREGVERRKTELERAVGKAPVWLFFGKRLETKESWYTLKMTPVTSICIARLP